MTFPGFNSPKVKFEDLYVIDFDRTGFKSYCYTSGYPSVIRTSMRVVRWKSPYAWQAIFLFNIVIKFIFSMKNIHPRSSHMQCNVYLMWVQLNVSYYRFKNILEGQINLH